MSGQRPAARVAAVQHSPCAIPAVRVSAFNVRARGRLSLPDTMVWRRDEQHAPYFVRRDTVGRSRVEAAGDGRLGQRAALVPAHRAVSRARHLVGGGADQDKLAFHRGSSF
ncbi:hypothetical protein ACCO45_004020 [Purpureocillium lilacinum]|uniref:Uncharacterized protein n=1 Tax=Purpureocillium lilacinum TaxID=33203 RepID=A0ACC4E1L7_PURLI